jgi:CAAX prenyl protease-like protein
MAESGSSSSGRKNAAHSIRRDLVELAIAYGLILLVIWTPRTWQRHLWWITAAVIGIIACISFDSLKAMGLTTVNFFRSLWVTGAALLVAALALFIAVELHTLHLPSGPILFIKIYWEYALWACVQQFLLLGFFLPRFLRLMPGTNSAAILAACLFAFAHLPNPILTPITLIWGLVACLLFLHYRNLYPLAMAHAIVGISIAITIPGPVDHNMRVGLGYLTYRQHTHNPPRLPQP